VRERGRHGHDDVAQPAYLGPSATARGHPFRLLVDRLVDDESADRVGGAGPGRATERAGAEDDIAPVRLAEQEHERVGGLGRRWQVDQRGPGVVNQRVERGYERGLPELACDRDPQR
jgi:hypothetical protein